MFSDDVLRVSSSEILVGSASYRLDAVSSVRVHEARENSNEKIIGGFALFVGFDMSACGLMTGADGIRTAGFYGLGLGALALMWATWLSPKRYWLAIGTGGSETFIARYQQAFAAQNAAEAIRERLRAHD